MHVERNFNSLLEWILRFWRGVVRKKGADCEKEFSVSMTDEKCNVYGIQ